jgi:hypothetical protein
MAEEEKHTQISLSCSRRLWATIGGPEVMAEGIFGRVKNLLHGGSTE